MFWLSSGAIGITGFRIVAFQADLETVRSPSARDAPAAARPAAGGSASYAARARERCLLLEKPHERIRRSGFARSPQAAASVKLISKSIVAAATDRRNLLQSIRCRCVKRARALVNPAQQRD